MNSLIAAIQIGLVMGLIMSFAVFALGIAYRMFDFPDLTVEGSFLFGAVGFAVLYKMELGYLTSFVGSMLLGAFAGCLTGYIHARFNLNKFLTAIIIVAVVYSLSLRLMGGANIGILVAATNLDSGLEQLTILPLRLNKIIVLLVLTVCVFTLVIKLLKTRAGLKLRVAGCNPFYARNLGIGVVLSYMAALAFTNGLAAASGALLALHQGFADIGLVQGVLIITLASLSIGERIIAEDKFSLPVFVAISALIGSIIYQIAIASAVNAGLNPNDLKLVTALIVLAVVIIRKKHSHDPLITT